MTRWMAVNGEAVFASRPWRRFGEGPTQAVEGMQNEEKASAFTAKDVRFTARDGKLYAAFLGWPERPSRVVSLAGLPVERVTLLGRGALPFRMGAGGLEVTLPAKRDGEFVPVLRLEGPGLI